MTPWLVRCRDCTPPPGEAHVWWCPDYRGPVRWRGPKVKVRTRPPPVLRGPRARSQDWESPDPPELGDASPLRVHLLAIQAANAGRGFPVALERAPVRRVAA